MPDETPDLRQIRAFVAVAETANFTRAAERLFLTQSAVSHSVRGLEELLDAKLLERLGRKVSLTQNGVIFLRRCRRVLDELENASRELDAMKRWGQGRIRIGATHSMCQYLLPVVLREFRDCFPRCEIHIESGDTGSLLELLERAQIDLVLGIATRVPLWSRFQPLFDDQLAFVVSPIHPWASMERIPLEEIAKESFLVYARASETYRVTREHFEEAGIRLRATLSLGNMEAIKEMAKIGIGVGIVAPWVARRELEEGDLVAISAGDIPLTRSWGCFSHEARQVSLVEETFVGICEQVTLEFGAAPGEGLVASAG